MLSIAEIVEKINDGTKLEDVIPEGACPHYWKRIVANYNACKSTPKTKRSHTTRRTNNRTFRADSVLARPSLFEQQEQQYNATADLVSRVNGNEPEEPRQIPWFVNGECRILEV